MRRQETAEGRSVRLLRVGEQVRHVLSELLQRGDVHDEVLQSHLVSVTEVRMSPDLRHAKVFVSVLGSERKREATLAGLSAAHGVLQSRLAHELRMKRTPTLAFEYDPSVERGVRMSQLIDELAPDDNPGR